MSSAGPLGMETGTGLLRLLQVGDPKGITTPSLEASIQAATNLDDLLGRLRAEGISASKAWVDPATIPDRQFPALAQLHSGAWILLHRRSLRGYWVEGDPGWEEYQAATQVQPHLTGLLLRVEPMDIPVGGFWTRVWRHGVAQRKLVFLLIPAALLFHAMTAAAPQFTKIFINQALTMGDLTVLYMVSWGILGLTLFRAFAGWILEDILLHLACRLELAMEKEALEHLLWLPFRTLQAFAPGELLQRFSGIAAFNQWVVETGGVNMVLDFTCAMGYWVLMYWVLPGPSLTLLALMALTSGVVWIMGLGIAQLNRQRIQLETQENAFLVEMLNGVQTLKATGTLSWCQNQWHRRFMDTRTCSLSRERRTLWLDTSLDYLNLGLNGLCLVWGGLVCLGGQVDIGTLLAFLLLLAIFIRYMFNLMRSLRKFLLIRPDVQALQSFFSLPHCPTLHRQGPRTLQGPLVIDDLWFRYSEQSPWLYQGYSLKVAAGTIQLIQGPSGSGKSTLLKLVAGLYTASSGTISVGGLDVVGASRLMIYLPQFTTLLNGSIQENLDFFSGRAPWSHILEVAEEIGLTDWLSRLPEGYDTLLSNGGSNLSGGQRQHLLLTAILASSKPLLLLDEAMSNLDWMTRRRILHSRFFAGRTVLYASHEERLVT